MYVNQEDSRRASITEQHKFNVESVYSTKRVQKAMKRIFGSYNLIKPSCVVDVIEGRHHVEIEVCEGDDVCGFSLFIVACLWVY